MEKANNRIDATYVINMDADTGRLEEFNTMMENFNWPYIRHPAVNGKHLFDSSRNNNPDELELMDRLIKRPTWLSASEIGCSLSHVSLWEKVATDPFLQRILIFEDDARTHADGATIERLIDDFYSYLEDNNIQEPDMLYLGKSLDYCSNYEKIWGNIYKSRRPLCLHAYIMTKAGANKLLSMAPYRAAIDMIPLKAIEKNVIEVAVFHPSLFFQDIFGLPIGARVSDLGTNSNLRNLRAALNNTTECIVQQQHVAGDTWEYVAVVSVGLIAALLLFIFFAWSTTRAL